VAVESSPTLQIIVQMRQSRPVIPFHGLFTKGAEYCADFRRILMGDVDLQREIWMDGHSGVVSREYSEITRNRSRENVCDSSNYHVEGVRERKRIG
jgi:hypothetical protein